MRWWILAAALWPVVIITASFLWPGPWQQQHLYRYYERPAFDPIQAPVDTLGSRGELTVSDEEGSARIFWTQPTSGNVELTIEVPPEKE